MTTEKKDKYISRLIFNIAVFGMNKWIIIDYIKGQPYSNAGNYI